jgi:predicted P-loop ATPase
MNSLIMPTNIIILMPIKDYSCLLPASYHAQRGRLSKSVQQLTSSGLAPNSDEIRLKLLSKILRADNAFIDVEESEDNVAQLEIEDDEIIWEVLKSFDNTVGVDYTGLTP